MYDEEVEETETGGYWRKIHDEGRKLLASG